MADIYAQKVKLANAIVSIPGVAKNELPRFRSGHCHSDNPRVVQMLLERDDVDVAIEPGEEGLLFGPVVRAHVVLPDGTEFDGNFADLAPQLVDHDTGAPVAVDRPISAAQALGLEMYAPTQPPAPEVFICQECGEDFAGGMAKARFAKHMNKHPKDD